MKSFCMRLAAGRIGPMKLTPRIIATLQSLFVLGHQFSGEGLGISYLLTCHAVSHDVTIFTRKRMSMGYRKVKQLGSRVSVQPRRSRTSVLA